MVINDMWVSKHILRNCEENIARYLTQIKELLSAVLVVLMNRNIILNFQVFFFTLHNVIKVRKPA